MTNLFLAALALTAPLTFSASPANSQDRVPVDFDPYDLVLDPHGYIAPEPWLTGSNPEVPARPLEDEIALGDDLASRIWACISSERNAAQLLAAGIEPGPPVGLRLVDAQGAPIAGLEVSACIGRGGSLALLDDALPIPFGAARTDANGFVELPWLATLLDMRSGAAVEGPGQWSNRVGLASSLERGVLHWFDLDPRRAGGSVVRLSDASWLEFEFEPFVDATGAPLAGVELVRSLPMSCVGPWWQVEAQVPPGAERVRLGPYFKWDSLRGAGASFWLRHRDLDVRLATVRLEPLPGGTTRRVELVHEPYTWERVELCARLVDRSGRPLVGVEVDLDGAVDELGLSDGEGVVRWSVPKGREVTSLAHAECQASFEYQILRVDELLASRVEAADVQLACFDLPEWDGRDHASESPLPEAGRFALDLQVVDRASRPVPGAWLEVVDTFDQNLGLSKASDSEGRARVSVPKDTTTFVRVGHPDLRAPRLFPAAAGMAEWVVLPIGSRVALSLRMDPGGDLSGNLAASLTPLAEGDQEPLEPRILPGLVFDELRFRGVSDGRARLEVRLASGATPLWSQVIDVQGDVHLGELDLTNMLDVARIGRITRDFQGTWAERPLLIVIEGVANGAPFVAAQGSPSELFDDLLFIPSSTTELFARCGRVKVPLDLNWFAPLAAGEPIEAHDISIH